MRRLVAVVVAAVLAAVALGAAPAQAAGRVITPAFFGMHDPYLDATVPYGSLRVWDVGTTWADIEQVPGVFDFAHLDSIVAAAERRHVRITLVLGTTPAWAAKDPHSVSAAWLPPGSSSPPSDEAYWSRYVKTVAHHYAGRIDSYQIWNEASLPVFWRGTPKALAHLTLLASRAIHHADPRSLVVSTPMLPRQPSWSTWSMAYLKGLRAYGWPVDAFAIHSYQPDKLANPDGRVAGIRKMKAVLRAAKAPARPMWDTEANYSSNAYATGKVRGHKAADWVARVYLDSLRLRVARTYWYAFDAPVGHLGVTLEPGNAASRGFSAVSSWLLGSTWQGCKDKRAKKPRASHHKSPLVTTCHFTRGRTSSYVVWAASGRAPLPAAAKAKSLCTLLDGCHRVTRRTRVSTSPVLLRR